MNERPTILILGVAAGAVQFARSPRYGPFKTPLLTASLTNPHNTTSNPLLKSVRIDEALHAELTANTHIPGQTHHRFLQKAKGSGTSTTKTIL